jgi:hypothetical protein
VTWQPYTMKFMSDVYSFTTVDVKGASLTLRQLSETGDEIDRIVVTKPLRARESTATGKPSDR